MGHFSAIWVFDDFDRTVRLSALAVWPCAALGQRFTTLGRLFHHFGSKVKTVRAFFIFGSIVLGQHYVTLLKCSTGRGVKNFSFDEISFYFNDLLTKPDGRLRRLKI